VAEATGPWLQPVTFHVRLHVGFPCPMPSEVVVWCKKHIICEVSTAS
jgi:hypothetical protein